MKKINILLLLAVFAFTQNLIAQFTVNTSLPVQQVIQNFVGTNITISNVTFTGGPLSIGSFNSTTNYPMSMGLLLSSGNIDSTLGTPASTFVSGALSMPGDADLDALTSTNITFDAAVLEFDFVASGTSFEFHYSFASEEYNEYVNSAFNDIFGLFLSGPGLNAPVNLATIPGTTLPVSINNVNNGTSGTGPCMNCAYYIDNAGDTTMAMDGLTTILTAQHAIIPGQTYHVKIAVADNSDMIFDSAVMLEAYSLKSTGNTSVVEINNDAATVYISNGSIVLANLTDNVSLELIDAQGRMVYSQEGNKNISLENLPRGNYVLQVNDGKRITHKRLTF